MKRDDLVEEAIGLDGHVLHLLRPRDTEALLDVEEFERSDAFIAYWADLWPSAILLARTIAARALRGARVLELGCGLGLPSLAAALAGGRPLAADWAEDAVAAVSMNAEHNRVSVDTLVSDWQQPAELLERGPFDLVIAADVLYERRNIAPLYELLRSLDAEVWLADPGRPPAAELIGNLELAGWERSTLAETERPRVAVHRLRPGRMF